MPGKKLIRSTRFLENVPYRPTWAHINLGALRENFFFVRSLVGPAVKVLVTVKADAYGHGIINVAQKLVDCAVDYLGVASIDEAVLLRRAGIGETAILILGEIPPFHLSPLVEYDLSQTVCTLDLAQALNRQARLLHKKAKVHIKIDTGMGRLGVWHEKAVSFIKVLSRLKNLEIEGVFTHFPCADTDPRLTEMQIKNFHCLLENLQKESLHIPLSHAANSIGLIRFPHSHFNLVRPGLMVYGINPHPGLKTLHLKPVMSLKSRIVFYKRVPAGRGISYGHTYTTSRSTAIATVPIGYGDGYMRSLSNKAFCLLRGRRCRVVGRVCMDYMMIEAGGLTDLRYGEEVVLIGRQGRQRITVEEMAEWAGTIPYEVVCSIGSRVVRVYEE